MKQGSPGKYVAHINTFYDFSFFFFNLTDFSYESLLKSHLKEFLSYPYRPVIFMIILSSTKAFSPDTSCSEFLPIFFCQITHFDM